MGHFQIFNIKIHLIQFLKIVKFVIQQLHNILKVTNLTKKSEMFSESLIFNSWNILYAKYI